MYVVQVCDVQYGLVVVCIGCCVVCEVCVVVLWYECDVVCVGEFYECGDFCCVCGFQYCVCGVFVVVVLVGQEWFGIVWIGQYVVGVDCVVVCGNESFGGYYYFVV